MRILNIIFFLFLYNFNYSFSQGIGKERWSIKTLNDSLSNEIDTNFIKISIDSLYNFGKPNDLKNSTKRLDIEKKSFLIRAKIIEYIKQDDYDYHLIVSDINDQTKTIIVEIIMPKYGNKKYYAKLKKVRDELSNRIRNRTLKGKIFDIGGVAFFDFLHNQKGKAPNGLELHPVLIFKIVN